MYIVVPSERTSFREAWDYSANLQMLVNAAFDFIEETTCSSKSTKRGFFRKKSERAITITAKAASALEDAQVATNNILEFVFANEVNPSPSTMLEHFANGIMADVKFACYMDGYVTFLQRVLKQLIESDDNELCTVIHSPALLWCFYMSDYQELQSVIYRGNPFKTQKKDVDPMSAWMLIEGIDDD